MLEKGSVVKGYTTIQELGRGGSSVVYLSKKDDLYVIKEVRNKDLLINEAVILDDINHPQIVKIKEMIYPHYLILEYIRGKTIDQYQFKENEVIEIGIQLCDLLSYLHHLKPPVIYRDLKPANIIYDQGLVKLIDFGISKRGIKKDTQLLGTKGYSAPELYEGISNELSDLYSLGKTLENIVDIQSYRLKEIIEKCTKENPNERYTSADEVKQELRKLKKWRFYYDFKSRNTRAHKSS